MRTSDPTELPDAFLTEREVAKRWKVSVKTLQARRLKGEGPRYVKIGRLVRYPTGDLLVFEDEHARLSTSESN